MNGPACREAFESVAFPPPISTQSASTRERLGDLTSLVRVSSDPLNVNPARS